MAETPEPIVEVQEAPPPDVRAQTLYPHHFHPHKKRSFLHKHSLSIVSVAIVITWIVAYRYSDPSTHIGSFFGNAIADWSGVVVTVLATKWLYEKNSAESRKCPPTAAGPIRRFFHEHSLTVFLLITGIGWVVLFAKMDANGKWGQVVGNLVSEWTQIFGMVLLTKKLIEWKSKGG
jgi:hypothetical protein